MTSQLNYLIAQQRQSELVRRAEQHRLAQDARAARSTASPRSHIRRLLAPRNPRAAGSAAAARQTNPGAPHERLRCDT
jgi:hypothetical protein